MDSDLSSITGESSSNQSQIEEPSNQGGLKSESPSKKQLAKKQGSQKSSLAENLSKSFESAQKSQIDFSEQDQGSHDMNNNAENHHEQAMRVLLNKMNYKKVKEEEIAFFRAKIIDNESQNIQFRKKIKELQEDVSHIDQEMLGAIREQHTKDAVAGPQ